MLELAMRQRRAMSAFTARQAQDYLRAALAIRKDKERTT
jgi:hypothetical protein